MTKQVDEPPRPYCLIGWQPCGCMGIASWIDQDTTRNDVQSVEGKIRRRGYRREVYADIKGLEFECPEHKALRDRMIAEKEAKKLETATETCPACGGEKRVMMFIDYANGSGLYQMQDCSLCAGYGTVHPSLAAKVREAARLNISAKELSDREAGRK